MKKTLLPLMVFSCSLAIGQVKKFSVSFGPNYTAINSTTEQVEIQSSAGFANYTDRGVVKHSYSGKVGFDVSANVDFSISKRFFITTGLSSNYIRFERNTKIVSFPNQSVIPEGMNTVVTPGTSFGSIFFTDQGGGNTDVAFVFPKPKNDKSVLYLSVPVLIGTSFFNDRVSVRTGPNFSVLLNATYYNSTYNYWTGTFNTTRENSTTGYNSFRLGINTQVTFQLTKSLGLEVSYQNNVTPLYSDDDDDGGVTINKQFGLGLNLTF